MQRFNKNNVIWLGLIILGFFAIKGAVAAGLINNFHQITLVTVLINIIFAVGLNLVIGVAGQFSLGHAGFIALGAYTTAVMTKESSDMGTFFLSMAVGMILAVVVALIVGLPTLRLRGDYLAIATLGIGEIIRVVINNMRDITNGPAGISGIPKVTNWELVYVLMVLSTVLIMNYVNSSQGRATYSILQDSIAAEAMGVNVTKYKVIPFVMGAATAAMGGSLLASYLGIVTPSDFSFTRSIDILIIVVFGGIGSFTGSFIAAITLGILNLVLMPYGQLRMIIYAIALILIMIFRPGGLLGMTEFRVSNFTKKKQASKEVG